MLIQKPMDTGDIVSFKLVNGDEIVAKFVSQDTNTLIVSKPVIVAIQPHGNNQVSLGFMPFMVSSDDETKVSFPISNILMKALKTRPDVANNYRRATSDLEIPAGAPSGLVI